MVDNPLFYANIVPLNRETHAGLRIDTSATRFGFAAKAHLIPAVLDELIVGGRHLPIVFVPGPEQPSMAFLTGLRPGENSFVDGSGRWLTDYIPAFVRRAPFIIGDPPGAEPLVCIDEASPLISEKGDALFKDGEATPFLKANIQLMNDYLAAAKRTEAFAEALKTLGLFRGITIDAKLPDQHQTFHGLLTIDVEKLADLPDQTFIDLRKEGYLPLIYAQQFSLAALEKLASGFRKAA